MSQDVRIAYAELQNTFARILLNSGFDAGRADACATVFADNSLYGVYSHGINRFGRFVQNVKNGEVIPQNEPVKKGSFGATEQWDGQLGPGPLNAIFCTDRAIELAKTNGISCVALSNTNHWMRGGTYARQAAKQGMVFICWTNTIANMPAWGARESKLGNNPLIMAVPFNDDAIVLDMAISQFSYGAMEKMVMSNSMLPVVGGYDEHGHLTNDPEVILRTNRSLPIGFWKGSGLALLLDILAAILSGGKSTAQITQQKIESGLSQVFIAINLSLLQNRPSINNLIQSIVHDYHAADLDLSGNELLYPGERVLKRRDENLKLGIPVNAIVWNDILSLM